MDIEVLFLETSLDKSPKSTRSQINYLREFLRHYRVDVAARQVHSLTDLKYFLGWASSRPRCKVVHLVSHGSGTTSDAKLYLTDGTEVDLGKPEGRNVFKNLERKILFLSSCRVGNAEGILTDVLHVSKATAIFSYTKKMNDRECFLIESMFYHRYLTAQMARSTSQRVFDDVYRPLRDAIEKVFGTKGSRNWLVVDPWQETP